MQLGNDIMAAPSTWSLDGKQYVSVLVGWGGATLFARRCSMCHGIVAVSGGAIADLRYALPATYDAFDRIVRQGAYQGLGMPKFDFLSEADVASVKSYVLSRRTELTDAAH